MFVEWLKVLLYLGWRKFLVGASERKLAERTLTSHSKLCHDFVMEWNSLIVRSITNTRWFILILQMMLDIMERTERTLLLYILALFYLRIVPHLSSGVVNLISFSSFCTTPQRGSLRRSRLGSTKGDKLFRATRTCISVGKQRMIKPCLNPENGTEGS